MAPWLIQALRLLAGGLGAGAAFETGQGLVSRGEYPTRGGNGGGGGGGFGLADIGNIVLPGDPFGAKTRRRRRRRRALTASDKADIAFIVGLLGPAAGKQFSTTLAARPR